MSCRNLVRALTPLLLALLALTVSGTATPARAAGDGDGATSWTVRTALSEYGSNRALYSYTVNPGRAITDGIDIANRGTRPITLAVYAADGFTNDEGGFDILTADKRSTDVGSWVTPSVGKVTVPAGQEVQVPFRLAVPDDATPGDHVGGIVTVLDQKDPAQGNTVIHQRVGLRIKVRVSGALTPRLEVADLNVDFDGGANPFATGAAHVTYTVRNTGNVVLGATQTLELSGAAGTSGRTVDLGRVPDLLPGDSWAADVPVDGVHALLWVSGKLTVTPVQTDAAGSTSQLDPVTATDRDVVSVWSWVVLIGSLVVVLALVWALVVAVRRWRRRAAARVEAKVAAAVEEALDEAGRT